MKEANMTKDQIKIVDTGTELSVRVDGETYRALKELAAGNPSVADSAEQMAATMLLGVATLLLGKLAGEQALGGG